MSLEGGSRPVARLGLVNRDMQYYFSLRSALKRLVACNSTANLDTSCTLNDGEAKPTRLFLSWVAIITEWFTKTTHRRINTRAHGQAFFENSKGQLISVPAVKALWRSRAVNHPSRPKSAPDDKRCVSRSYLLNRQRNNRQYPLNGAGMAQSV